jgi:hypothetical protein
VSVKLQMPRLALRPVLSRPESCSDAKGMFEVRLGIDVCVSRVASVVPEHLDATIVFTRHCVGLLTDEPRLPPIDAGQPL